MTREEIIKKASKMNVDEATIYGAILMSDALNRLASAQERQADILEKQWALANGMMDKLTPMMDKSMEMMDDETKGDSWKKGYNDNED